MTTTKNHTLRNRMLIMIGAVLVLVAALAFFFYLHVQKLIASAPKPGAQTVSTVAAGTLEWQPQLASVGSLTALRGIDVTTEIAGLVRSVHFRSGQDVKAGALLVQLNADADVAQLNALQAAADLAVTTLKRDRQQLKAQAVSQALIDNDEADLKSKRALVAQQAALVAKKTIRAPFAGRLGISTLNPGQYLNPGDKIVTLQTIDPIYADFSLPQKQIASVAIEQTINLSVDAFTGKRFPGTVTAISPKVDPTTRNVSLQATIANPDKQLLPGMFGQVSVDVGEKMRYLTLPQTAITYNPYGSTVFLVVPASELAASNAASGAASGAATAGAASVAGSGPASAAAVAQASAAGTGAAAASSASAAASGASGLVAQQVFVTTGETRGDQVAITKGVREGQQVVSSGQLKLKNGTPVRIDNSVQPANDPNPKPQEN